MNAIAASSPARTLPCPFLSRVFQLPNPFRSSLGCPLSLKIRLSALGLFRQVHATSRIRTGSPDLIHPLKRTLSCCPVVSVLLPRDIDSNLAASRARGLLRHQRCALVDVDSILSHRLLFASLLSFRPQARISHLHTPFNPPSIRKLVRSFSRLE